MVRKILPRSLFVLGLLLALAAVLAESADAQRRRRRRVRQPAPTEQVEPVSVDAGIPTSFGDAGSRGHSLGAPTSPATTDAGVPTGTAAPIAPQANTGNEGEENAEASESTTDLEPLRAEYTALVDDIVQLRSRVAVLGRQLFRTKVSVSIQNRAGDDQALESVLLSLDGASIFRGESSAIGDEDGRRVFEGFAAPGPHQLTVEVEQRSRTNDQYRYTIRDTYRFEVVRNRVTEVTVVLDDDSGIAEDFPDDGEGEYDVRTRVRVATRELEGR